MVVEIGGNNSEAFYIQLFAAIFTLYAFIYLQMVLWHIFEYVCCHAHIFYLYKVDLRIHETGFGAYEDIIQGY